MSMVIDHYTEDWQKRYLFPTVPIAPNPWVTYPLEPFPLPPLPSPAEMDGFRDLAKRARKYDKDNNEPDCELAEKRRRIQELADQLGVNIDFLDEPTELEVG